MINNEGEAYKLVVVDIETIGEYFRIINGEQNFIGVKEPDNLISKNHTARVGDFVQFNLNYKESLINDDAIKEAKKRHLFVVKDILQSKYHKYIKEDYMILIIERVITKFENMERGE